jgi:hypothetical protein
VKQLLSTFTYWLVVVYRSRSPGIISRLKNTVDWFFIREKYCSGWKNKLNKTDYKPDEHSHNLPENAIPITGHDVFFWNKKKTRLNFNSSMLRAYKIVFDSNIQTILDPIMWRCPRHVRSLNWRIMQGMEAGKGIHIITCHALHDLGPSVPCFKMHHRCSSCSLIINSAGKRNVYREVQAK